MNKLKTRTTRVHLTPDSILHDQAFSIEITDNGAGEFLLIRSDSRELAIEPKEWPGLRNAIDIMFNNIQENS